MRLILHIRKQKNIKKKEKKKTLKNKQTVSCKVSNMISATLDDVIIIIQEINFVAFVKKLAKRIHSAPSHYVSEEKFCKASDVRVVFTFREKLSS